MQDHVAIVTGGANGIGRATCLEFARAGANVVVVDIDSAGAEATRDAIITSGGQAIAVAADVSQSADVQRYIQTAVDTYGRIDVLVNNAGVGGPFAHLTDYPEDAFERVLSINVMGTFMGIKYVLPVMLAQGKGAIVNMASVAGTVGAPGLGAYSASKHAVVSLTRTAAGEVGRKGVRVNAVCPGPIQTELIDALHARINPDDPDSVRAFNVGRNPMGRYGEPEEVAKVVFFLASDAASYVNGVAWLIDGGRTAI